MAAFAHALTHPAQGHGYIGQPQITQTNLIASRAGRAQHSGVGAPLKVLSKAKFRRNASSSRQRPNSNRAERTAIVLGWSGNRPAMSPNINGKSD